MSLPSLRITTARLGLGSYLVTVFGELDIETAPILERELNAISRLGGRGIVVDLLGVSFIDSVGLGVLTAELRRLRGRGGDVVLACDDPRVLHVFEVTGLERAFAIRVSLRDAIDRIGALALT